ncbi:MAG: Ribosome biogenesis protein brx1 [Pycnora praestabilis]|nr:MAG: Ribosome biogenesis protein brx1 [Pycnora praestabilis]
MASVYKSLSKVNGKENAKDVAKNGVRKNKQRVLILSSRGVTMRHRHLLNDLYSLLPHSRKDAKLDTKTKLYQLNELAELYNCNNVFFFEARKGKDLYLWISKAPNGPTVKMHLQNRKSYLHTPTLHNSNPKRVELTLDGSLVHTMEELHFPGNCLRGSRPILSFDSHFDSSPHLRVMKELLSHIFGVPKGARKTKPFVDHVMGFTLADGKVWIRVYQISEAEQAKSAKPVEGEGEGDGVAKMAKAKSSHSSSSKDPKETNISLVEIGPRFVLTPIVILESSFGGPVIFENKEFVSPNQIRSDLRTKKAGRYNRRADEGVERKGKMGDLGLRSSGGRVKERGELDDRVLFA